MSESQIDKWLEQARGGYSDEALQTAFELVEDPDNWKMPIDAVVPADADIKAIDTAVTWFAGCMAEITPVKSGETVTGYRVVVAGYYNSVGA